MTEKNKVGNLILEIIKLVVVIGIMIIAYKSGVITNKDGSFDTGMSLFIILPLFVVGRSAYNFYRNYKYRRRE